MQAHLAYVRATQWQLRPRTIKFPRRPLIMGIVNVTPDSFSDGGQFFDTAAAVTRALQLVADGADILDIGGESARPYADPVTAAAELRPVVPVFDKTAAEVTTTSPIATIKAARSQR